MRNLQNRIEQAISIRKTDGKLRCLHPRSKTIEQNRRRNDITNATGIKNRGRHQENLIALTIPSTLHYEPYDEAVRSVPIRDHVCSLCENTVSMALDIPISSMRAKTRCNAESALARQIAMYLCHTTFSILLTEIGLHFRRDRTTVSYACALIEDRRDDIEFDTMICQLENLLLNARQAMSMCIGHDGHPSSFEPERMRIAGKKRMDVAKRATS